MSARSSPVSGKNVTRSSSAIPSGQLLSLASSASDRKRTGMSHAIRAGQGRTRPVGRTALTARKGIRLRAQATLAAKASSVQT
jgi:hypothetical protein